MSSGTAVLALRRQWGLLALLGYGAIAAVGLSEPRWLAGAATLWTYCLWILFQGLEENRGEGEGSLFPSFGLPTCVTVVRGGLLAVVAGFLFLPAPSAVPAAFYTLAVLLDHVDGRLARALGRTTRLGERLDMEVDAAGILVASLLAAVYGKVPIWYVAIGSLRYVFVLGIGFRRRRQLPVAELDPSSLRRWLAGLQMGFLAVTLWPVVPAELTRFAAPFFAGATAAMFLRDWRVVSCRLDPAA